VGVIVGAEAKASGRFSFPAGQRALARPAAGVDPASFQDYKPAAGPRAHAAREQLKGLIRAGYVYRNGDEHLLTDMGRDALAQTGVYPSADAPSAPGSNARASVARPDALFHLGR
jgi:hypothetical protein